MPEEAKTDIVQEQPQVQSPVDAGQQESTTPDVPQKYTVDELHKKLTNGEIDVSTLSPEDLQEMVATDGEAQPAPDQPVSSEQVIPSSTSQDLGQQHQQVDVPFFKSVGELLKHAKNETGLSFDNAADFITKVKDRLASENTASQQWQKDALTHKANYDKAQDDLAKVRADMEKLREEQAKLLRQAPQQAQQSDEPDFDADEPEIEPPDVDTADPSDWNAYYRKVRDRDNRITTKRMKHLEDTFTKRLNETQQQAERRLEAERQQIQKQEEARRQKEAQDRALEETAIAADDFISRHREFDYGDGVTTKAKNEQYNSFVQMLDYMAQTDPRMKGRNGIQLVQEYMSGNPITVQAVAERGIQVPTGIKEFAILVELNQIATKHNLFRGDSNRPDFDAAYAIKKNRDGADLDELIRAKAAGAQEALNVVQARQSAPTQIRAQDAHLTPTSQVSPEQLRAEVAALSGQLSNMAPDERSKTMVELESKLRQMGVEVNSPH